ncbi:Mitogen-activated protein kinase kinase kinase A [Phytophthora citrophthora]|uniref:Mitogen-activated protein kinase kinase kinase A n=1 Tax=Phytophthora citrophthora TaxID=4793 RepID=A0AAD9FZD7_9STRA|nr:Mitogen-activated protein kinase kinase kinase A [Phytophthora citrophthora]
MLALLASVNMKDTENSSSADRGGLSLDFPQDEYSLMFPPSPEHSPTGSSCNSWASEVGSPHTKSSSGDTSPEMKVKKWVRKEKIGQGAQGSIYRCEETTTGREVAVKVIWTKELPAPAVESVKREVKTMKRLRHRHLVRYLQATEKKQSELRIYMEYAAGGSLSSHLSRSGALSLPLVKRFTRQLCEALDYLHQNGIAHRDIKCANILLAVPKGSAGDHSHADIKLGDFGTFKVVGCASLVGGLKGTPHWMAPEVIRQQNMEEDDNHERWFRADVWSLGCAVLEMLTGRSPWQQYSNPLTAMYQIVSSESTPTIPADASEETVSFLNLCLQRNPEQRATLTQLLAHPFVRMARETKVKEKGSKRRTKRQECNQQSSHSLPSSPEVVVGKDLIPEPEPHEESSTFPHMESPNSHHFTSVKPMFPKTSSFDETQKMLHSPALQHVRESDFGSPHQVSPKLRRPRTPTLKPLESMTKPTPPATTNQDSNSVVASILSPNTRVTSAGKRLPRLQDLQAANGLEHLSMSPLRLRRIATAPTTATNLELNEDVFPDAAEGGMRLPPLSARPPKTRCTSANPTRRK